MDLRDKENERGLARDFPKLVPRHDPGMNEEHHLHQLHPIPNNTPTLYPKEDTKSGIGISVYHLNYLREDILV